RRQDDVYQAFLHALAEQVDQRPVMQLVEREIDLAAFLGGAVEQARYEGKNIARQKSTNRRLRLGNLVFDRLQQMILFLLAGREADLLVRRLGGLQQPLRRRLVHRLKLLHHVPGRQYSIGEGRGDLAIAIVVRDIDRIRAGRIADLE